MSDVHVISHPLVQHKLTLLRQVERSTQGFRRLVNEISMLLAYEVTRDLALEMTEIETPLARMAISCPAWAMRGTGFSAQGERDLTLLPTPH